MVVVIFLNIIVLILAYLESRRLFPHGLKISFILIFIFLAIRYNFGNDYQGYSNEFDVINRFSNLSIFDSSQKFEFGWVLLCRIFNPLGFQSLIIGLAFIECVVYYKFIKKYVPITYYWFAAFLFVFNVEFMLVHLSTMRQALATGIFVLSLEYLTNKDFIRYSLLICLAAIFHTSALILLPVFALSYFNLKIGKTVAFILFLIFIGLFVFGQFLLPVISSLINNTFEKYNVYEDSGSINSGFGLVVNSIFFIAVLYNADSKSKETDVLYKLGILNFLLGPLALILISALRISIYFSPALIFIYPNILFRTNNPFMKYGLGFLIIIFTLYTFNLFFNSEIWQKAYSNYETIFSL